MTQTVWKLPVPATALVRGPALSVLPRRRCMLSMSIELNDGKEGTLGLSFDGVEAFMCTYLTSLTLEMVELAYGKLIEFSPSDWLGRLSKDHQRPGRPAALKHFMICFDDGPCFEFICTSFEVLADKPSE